MNLMKNLFHSKKVLIASIVAFIGFALNLSSAILSLSNSIIDDIVSYFPSLHQYLLFSIDVVIKGDNFLNCVVSLLLTLSFFFIYLESKSFFQKKKIGLFFLKTFAIVSIIYLLIRFFLIASLVFLFGFNLISSNLSFGLLFILLSIVIILLSLFLIVFYVKLIKMVDKMIDNFLLEKSNIYISFYVNCVCIIMTLFYGIYFIVNLFSFNYIIALIYLSKCVILILVITFFYQYKKMGGKTLDLTKFEEDIK
jgi:hypothetical protein